MVCFDTVTLDCAVTSAGRIVRENTADGSSTYKVQHYLRDHLGSVRAVIDGDTGTVVETSDYCPFGKRIQVTAPVSEPVGGSQYASEPAVAPVAPATSVASTSSPEPLALLRQGGSVVPERGHPSPRLRRQDVQPGHRPLDRRRPAVREVLRHQPVCLLRE